MYVQLPGWLPDKKDEKLANQGNNLDEDNAVTVANSVRWITKLTA